MCNSRCNGNNILNFNRRVTRGINICLQGLCQCTQGLNEVRNNNICRGTTEISNGNCVCAQGLACIRSAVQNSGMQNRNICAGLRQCTQALRNINCGRCEICRNNINDGIEDVESGIRDCEAGLNRIQNGISNNTCPTNQSNTNNFA